MKDILIDCHNFTDRPGMHKLFADSLSFPEYYGSNLDALHDCLTAVSEPTRIQLKHWESAEECLGCYGRRTREAILEAAVRNPNLGILFD